ncbi:putative methyltransferase [Trypanosoma theileri]|uniref:Putative methyltransferase n=1 Tax=Trypanosoma theileri TaxID=67003 RepID=A0A1X0NRE9_9TRYP|nr:putative methyltransferase [Trypanosoma theileri]ORC86680.1 putative methyltransferase [Trypanosoma theileri]
MNPKNSEEGRGKRLRYKIHLFLQCCILLAALISIIGVIRTIDFLKDDEDPLARITQEIIYQGPKLKKPDDWIIENNLTGDKAAVAREVFKLKCFNSQHMEDLIMLQRFLGNVTNGFFIELGAFDGMSFSSTYFFERFMNWSGLLIEASPVSIAEHRQYYASARPRSEYIEGAVCAGLESLTSFVPSTSTSKANNIKGVSSSVKDSNHTHYLTHVTYGGCKPCSQILELLSPEQQEYLRQKCRRARETHGSSSLSRKISHLTQGRCLLTRIKCIRLDEVLRRRCVLKVDLFILDVEGAELEVLRTVDLLHGPPIHYIIVELSGKVEWREREVRRLLRAAGFLPRGRIVLSELWENVNFNTALRYYIQRQRGHHGDKGNNACTAATRPSNSSNSNSNNNNNNNNNNNSNSGVLYGPHVSMDQYREWIKQCFVGNYTPAMFFRESTQQWIPPFHTIDEVK